MPRSIPMAFSALGKGAMASSTRKETRVATSRITADGDGGGPGTFRQRATPENMQWTVHLCQGQLRSIPLESRSGIFCRLLSMLLLEFGVLRLVLKEGAIGACPAWRSSGSRWDTGDLRSARQFLAAF